MEFEEEVDVPGETAVLQGNVGKNEEVADFTAKLSRAMFEDHLSQGPVTSVIKHLITDQTQSSTGELRYVFEVSPNPGGLKYAVGAPSLLDISVADERLRKCTLSDARSATGGALVQETDALFSYLGWMSVQTAKTLEALPRAGINRALLGCLFDASQLNFSEAFISFGANAFLIPRLAHLCGHDHFNVTSIDLPEVRGNLVDDDQVPRQVARLAACFYEHAISEGERQSMLSAWQLGIVSGLTVHGHTDEAGWMRGLLRSTKYKRSAGYFSSTSDVFEVWDGRMTGKQLRARIYARAVMVMGMCTVAGASFGKETVIQLNYSAPHFEPALAGGSFRSQLLEFASRLDSMINSGFKNDGSNHVLVAATDYLSNLHADRHWVGETFFPWWCVEPSPVLPSHLLGDLDVGGFGRVTTLPRFDGKVDSDGLAAQTADNALWLRRSGLYYLYNESYNPLNGLNQFIAPLDRDTFFHGQASQVTLAGATWRRPDCAIPTPFEGNDIRGVTFYRLARAPFSLQGNDIQSNFTYGRTLNKVEHGKIGPGKDRFTPRYAKKALLDMLVLGLPRTRAHFWNIDFEEGNVEKQAMTAKHVSRMVSGDKFTVQIRARAPNKGTKGPITGLDLSPADAGPETEDVSRFIIPDSEQLKGWKKFLTETEVMDQVYDQFGGLAKRDTGNEHVRLFAWTQLMGVNPMQLGSNTDAILNRLDVVPDTPDEAALLAILNRYMLDNSLSDSTIVGKIVLALREALTSEAQ